MVEYLRETKGISCVEIFLLALLKRRGIDERFLYADSYMDIQDTVEAFLTKRHRYALYLGKPRLQSVAKQAGLIDLSVNHDPREEIGFDYSLYEVRSAYKEDGRFAPWREDHYLLRLDGAYYDCYPPAKLDGVEERFLTGKRIGITVHGSHPIPEIAALREAAVRSVPKPTKNIAFAIKTDNLIFVRDALLYVKVMRERMNALLECPAADRQIKTLAKLASLTEAFRLRRKIGPYGELLEELNHTEELWKETIFKKS